MRVLHVALPSIILLASACATSPKQPAPVDVELAGEGPAALPASSASSASSPPPPVAAGHSESCEAMVSGDAVLRASVVQAVDTGLGFWLRGVRVDPHLVGGRFRGWIVRSLYPGDACYGRIDIRSGDVVTKINGKDIERDWQAHGVFVALRTAPEIVVDYQRAGVAHKLRVAIVDR